MASKCVALLFPTILPLPTHLHLHPNSNSHHHHRRRRRLAIRAQDSDPPQQQQQQQQLNLSVLRFTLGIPGLDESYLPKWIGAGFGSLILLNHFLSSSPSAAATPPQLRSEALGLCLAAFSLALPYLGRFLEVGRNCSAHNVFVELPIRVL